MPDSAIDTLLAQQRIHDVLASYCRGLDRMDKDLARSVWHADGTAHYHDMYEGSGQGFVDWVWQAHAPMERHSHQLANSMIRVNGDRAASETYVTVVLWTLPDDKGDQLEIIARGRYLDSWDLREGRWAISHREHIVDMQTVTALSRGAVSTASRRDSTDPSYALLGPG